MLGAEYLKTCLRSPLLPIQRGSIMYHDPKSHPRTVISRRNFLTLLAGSSTAALLARASNTVRAANIASIYGPLPFTEGTTLTPEQALAKLMEGNKRYVSAKLEHPDQTADRRIEVAKGQSPFAVILTCSDSRVAPEILFDQGLGDLFVLRTAGNVLADVVIGSIEYAVEHLGAPLIMVLGHERCGAVSAAVDMVTKHATFPGHIGSLADAIKPAVDVVKDKGGDLVDAAVSENARMVAGLLEDAEPILSEAVHSKHIMIVSARYDLDDGEVKLL
jgi:carbonic anhydrase